jgi:hypothetical protein
MFGLLTMPFKLLTIPGKFLLGFVGVIIASLINAFIIDTLAKVLAWNNGWAWMSQTYLSWIFIITFVLSLCSGYGD